MSDGGTRSAEVDREAVREAARTNAPDHYLAALLAPRRARDDLVVFAAYLGEIRRVPLSVAEPMMGLMRLQWWRDGLQPRSAGDCIGHPVADALANLLRRGVVTPAELVEPLDAYDHLVERGGLTAKEELDAYIEATAVLPFRLAARLAGVATPNFEPLVVDCGAAYGKARLALDLPYYLARGRVPLPPAYFDEKGPSSLDRAALGSAVTAATARLADEARRALENTRRPYRQAPWALRGVLSPVALVEPYFKALQRPDRDPVMQPSDIAPVVRPLRLWLARTFASV